MQLGNRTLCVNLVIFKYEKCSLVPTHHAEYHTRILARAFGVDLVGMECLQGFLQTYRSYGTKDLKLDLL